jgi:hypothetical protein
MQESSRSQCSRTRQFFETKIDEERECELFLRRFRKHAPTYLRQRQRRFGDDGTGALVEALRAFYELVLLGRLNDGRMVKVTLA